MKNKGFSLVELIVVIAIMAILVGVAVPVYSSYIEKTQKAKDEQLVDEIKHAVEIASIGETWASKYGITSDGTYLGAVVLKKDANAIVEQSDIIGTAIEDALIATFGTDYASKLTLSYSGYTGTLAGGNANYVAGSSYQGKVPQLMGDIQTLTTALKEYITTNNLADVMGSAENGSAFDTWLEQLAAEGKINPDSEQEVANAATLYVASSTLGKTSNKEIQDAFVAAWDTDKSKIGQLMTDSTLKEEIGLLAMVAAEYARAEALINHLNCDKARQIFASESNKVGADFDKSGAVDTQDVVNNIVAIMGAVNAHTPGCCAAGLDTYFAEDATGVSPAKRDALAYLAMLGQVNESKDMILSDIGNADLYKNESLSSYVNNYLSAAEAIANTGASDGDVVIVFSMSASGVLVASAYPLD